MYMYSVYELYALRIRHLIVLRNLANIDSKCLEDEYMK